MTRVPWATLSGNDAEDLIALLLFSEYPDGAQRITPSQGDGGMDVRISTPDGWDVYQIKKFYQAMDASQKTKVEGSFNAFVKEVADTGMAVKCWTVVMPWDPTREARRDFEVLTQKASFPVNWEGHTFLERLASDHPAAIDYFIGNGKERAFDLIKDAMQIGTPFASELPETELTGVAVTKAQESIAKVQEIEALLDRIDPYYKYRFTVEQVPHLPDGLIDFSQPPQTAYAKYRSIDDERCLVIRAFPRTEGMAQLRPIRVHFSLEPQDDTPEAEAVRQFVEHGTRLSEVPGSVTVLDDPTGLVENEGKSLISFMARVDPNLPDLEARLFGADGKLLHRVALAEPAPSMGLVEGGFSLSTQDTGGVFCLIAKGNEANRRYGFKVTLQDLTDKTPSQALPGLKLVRDLLPGNLLAIGVQGAGEIGYRVAVDKESSITQRATDLIEFSKVLLTFQQYTTSRVTFPDFTHLASDLLQKIGDAVDILNGKVLTPKWTRITITAAGAREVNLTAPPPNSALVQTESLIVDLGSYQLPLTVQQQSIFPTPVCSLAKEILEVLPDDAVVELTPLRGDTFYRRLPVEHVPRLVEID